MTAIRATLTGLENFGHKVCMNNFLFSFDLFDDLHT
jgi:hypothetical protein